MVKFQTSRKNEMKKLKKKDFTEAFKIGEPNVVKLGKVSVLADIIGGILDSIRGLLDSCIVGVYLNVDNGTYDQPHLVIGCFCRSNNLQCCGFGCQRRWKDRLHPCLSRAWESACASPSSTTIYVPQGRYLLNEVLFTGECKGRVTFKIDGTLVAPSDYHILGTSGKWITFNKVQGVSISGGILDGQGAGLWACKAAGKNCPFGARSLEFTYSSEITITGLTSMNSQIFHIVIHPQLAQQLIPTIHDCKNVKLQQVQVTASGNSPNTDGIHVQGSTDVTIIQANIKTGDDRISIGPGTTNLGWKTSICGPAMA
ncbi:hypothetical protein Syun_030231 [Stephania yunnanensis]|uniref:Polygalacturonase n=1 Tax=Stephania yunnanensis TaxID=152371 RepID=A0AAP0HKB6_9MAGN